MIEKQTRTRTKSAFRKRKIRSSENQDIVMSLNKNLLEIDFTNQTDFVESGDSVNEILEIPKQEDISIFKENKSEKNDILITESENDILNNLKTVTLTKENGAPLEGHLSCILLIIFIPLLLFFNKMCEHGGDIHYVAIREIKLKYFLSFKYIGFIFGWLIYLAVLSNVPVGKVIKIKTKEGFERKFRCNGFFSLVISTVVLLFLLYNNTFQLKLFFDNYYFLIGSSITVSFLISFFLLLKYYFSTKPTFLFRPVGLFNTFIFGREINQQLLGLDLKFFYEVRPGYTSWALINVLFCYKDWQDNEFSSVNLTLALSASAQIIYCIDSLIFERDLISKSFIEKSQFGLFHCFGNQVVVPFFFTLTSRTIQINKYNMPYKYLGGVLLLNFLGYVIYRSSNIQKNSFRHNPYSVHLCHLKTFTNHYGHQLLAGGWWGSLRHPNYLGDVLMIFSWSLYAGIHFSTCWIFPVYYMFCTITRCIQAEKAFSTEHGATWRVYQAYVPYKIIPFIF